MLSPSRSGGGGVVYSGAAEVLVVDVGSVIGEIYEVLAIVSTETGRGDFFLPPMALVYARRTACCFVGSELSSGVNLTARIASGTLAP
jgi:hypothetical protein